MILEPQQSADAGPWPGWEQQIIDGRFKLHRWIGGSDHSQVFLTEHLTREAAIKLLPVDLVSAPLLLERWRTAMALDHAHLMKLLDCGLCRIQERDCLFLVMPYAEETLAEILPQRALSAEETRALLVPVLDALAYLHERHWVHGHVQPSNILVVGDQLRLASDGASPLGIGGATRVSLYDPPDSASRRTPAGDLWALGATLLEALTRHAPLPGTPSGAPVVPDGVPADLRDLIHRCLQRDPTARPAAALLWSELTGQARASPAPAPLPPAPPAIPPPAPVTKATDFGTPASTPAPLAPRPRTGWVALALMCALGTIGWFAWSRHPRTPESTSAVAPVELPTSPPAASAQPAAPASTAPAAPAAVTATRQPSARSPEPAPPSSVSLPAEAVQYQQLPDVPRRAADTIHGHFNVVVRVTVDDSGQVVDARVEHAGPSAYFARLSDAAARRWKFAPRAARSSREWRLVFRFSRPAITAYAQPLALPPG